MLNEEIVKKTFYTGLEQEDIMINDGLAASFFHAAPDGEAPAFTMKEYTEMAEYARRRRAEKVKPVLSLRISQDTLAIAKATGKGYTGFLSRLLDNAIKDPQLVARSL